MTAERGSWTASRANPLTGTVAVVSGAGSGIGRAIARGLVEAGASVGFLDRVGDRVMEAIDGLGPNAFSLIADVTDEANVEAAFASVARRTAHLDILVNSAGVQLVGADAPVHELELATWSRTIAVNLTGVFLCCKHGTRLMLGRGGSVINIGSPTAMRGLSGGYHAYSASKGGVHALTRAMAADLGRYGIRVNTLVPGATDTGLTSAIFADETVRDRVAGRTPLGRIATPDDYVAIAVYLASSQAAYVTGSEFVVDGGRTAV